jgi:hypothetical protein
VITDEEQVDDSAKVLLSKDYYIYQNGWCKIPFAYEKAPEFDIQWDGVIGDRFNLDMSALGFTGISITKISNTPILADELLGYNVEKTYSDSRNEHYTIAEDYIDTNTYPGGVTICNGEIVSIYSADESNAALGLPSGYLTNGIYFFYNTTTECWISRLTAPSKVIKIDERYLPDMNGGVGKNVAGQEFEIDGEIVVAGNGAEIFNDYANNKATGRYSHAEGFASHAEGFASHAEGNFSHAEGRFSHAEGGTSHAEGHFSHAEGDYSHAEGDYSHAEGNYSHAVGKSQHVQGEYNLVDPEYNPATPNNTAKYTQIVGNGTSYNNRSNAHTLDWAGNAWFAGDVYVGGTGQDDESAVKLAKISDINVFVAEYGVTTYEEVKAAHESGKVCILYIGMATLNLTTITDTCAQFVGVQDIGKHDIVPTSTMAMIVRTVYLSDGWESASRLISDGVEVDKELQNKQDAITGTAGQFVVIGADGKPTTKAILISEEATF